MVQELFIPYLPRFHTPHSFPAVPRRDQRCRSHREPIRAVVSPENLSPANLTWLVQSTPL